MERGCCERQSPIWGDDSDDLSDGFSGLPLARTMGVEPVREMDEDLEAGISCRSKLGNGIGASDVELVGNGISDTGGVAGVSASVIWGARDLSS